MAGNESHMQMNGERRQVIDELAELEDMTNTMQPEYGTNQGTFNYGRNSNY